MAEFSANQEGRSGPAGQSERQHGGIRQCRIAPLHEKEIMMTTMVMMKLSYCLHVCECRTQIKRERDIMQMRRRFLAVAAQAKYVGLSRNHR